MLGEKRFLRSIRLRNILSFGPEMEELELKSLNVLIGPNGSGKSNLIEAIQQGKGSQPAVAEKQVAVRYPPGVRLPAA